MKAIIWFLLEGATSVWLDHIIGNSMNLLLSLSLVFFGTDKFVWHLDVDDYNF
jgi:hypothetical protein